MSEILESAIQTEIAADESMPLQLAEMYLDAGTLRWAAAKQNIVFPVGGNTYTAIHFTSGNKKTSRGGQIVSMEFQFDDRTGIFRNFNLIEPFYGKRFILKKTYRNTLSSALYYRERINGFMEEPVFDKEWMALRVVDGNTLSNTVLNDYYQVPCNNLFGDARCNKSGYADLVTLKATGKADSGTASTLVDNALTQAADFWTHGKIEITIAGVKHTRKVKSFDATTDTVTFDVELPIAVSAGDDYVLYKGCSQTWEACKKTYAYGPSSNNSANYNGYLHLTKALKEKD